MHDITLGSMKLIIDEPCLEDLVYIAGIHCHSKISTYHRTFAIAFLSVYAPAAYPLEIISARIVIRLATR